MEAMIGENLEAIYKGLKMVIKIKEYIIMMQINS